MNQPQYNYQGRGSGGHKQKERLPDAYSDPLKPEWLKDAFTDEARQWAEKFAKHLAENKYTTSQLRKFFGAFKRLQMHSGEDLKLGLTLLIPKTAYAAGRANRMEEKAIASQFHGQIEKAIQSVTEPNDSPEVRKRFDRFVHLLEAIVAYHKYHGGK